MMLGLSCILIATLLSMEALRRTHLFLVFGKLARHSRRSAWLVTRTGVSEWAKERALGFASRRMFAISYAVGLRLAIIVMPFAVIWALDRYYPLGLERAWTDWPGRFALFGITALYIGVRRISGGGDRVFQKIALSRPSTIELSFDIERTLYSRRASTIAVEAPVFIAGLARSGTSVLTRALHAGDDFASLSYRDLPFPLAPNIWAQLNRGWQRSLQPVERGHGDGLMDDLDSPEAIEEVFWLVHEGRRYRRPDRLLPGSALPETVVAFRQYVRLILLRYGGRKRYLSKNNTNVLRVPSLRDAFRDAIILHPYRDPLQQASSLLNQHRRARALAEADPARASFMTWLGHHEFGVDHRPFHLDDRAPANADTATLDYWLDQWIRCYTFLLDSKRDDGRFFINYDALCNDKARAANLLTPLLGLSGRIDFGDIRAPTIHSLPAYRESLRNRAYAVYDQMLIQSTI